MRNRIILLYLRFFRCLNASSRIIDFALKRYAGRSFLIDAESGQEISFAQLNKKIGQLAVFLEKAGLNAGDTVALLSPNRVEFFALRAACHFKQIRFLGLAPHLACEDISYFLNKTRTKILFHSGLSFDLSAVAKNIQAVHLDELEEKVFQNIHSGSLAGSAAPDRTVATLNLSSGTTKRTPKIVQITERNWVESLYSYVANSDLSAQKRIVFLCTTSFLTSGSTTFLPAFLSGLTYVVTGKDFSPELLGQYIDKYSLTRLYLTPSWLLEFMEWAKTHHRTFKSLTNIIIGTERVPGRRLKEAIDYFGPIINVGYGMVEALPPISLLTSKDYGRLDSVGRIVKGVRVKILDDGRIAVRSKTVSAGYLDNEEETQRCFRDGWFHTNDYGRIESGYLYVYGRKEEIIAECPRRIFAGQVEERLYELECIDRCAVMAKDGRVVLCVSLRPGRERFSAENQVREFCVKELTGLVIPDKIIVMDRLPVNALGKLDRRKLLEE